MEYQLQLLFDRWILLFDTLSEVGIADVLRIEGLCGPTFGSEPLSVSIIFHIQKKLGGI